MDNLDLDIEIEQDDLLEVPNSQLNKKQQNNLKKQEEFKSLNPFENEDDSNFLQNPSPLLSLEQNTAKIRIENELKERKENQKEEIIFNYPMQDGPVISWKEEAIKGNFMPAIIMLEKNQINVNDIVNPQSEERLIHIASTFSYLNVTRCLVEKFNADVNIRNKLGHSALHIVCNNSTQDLFLLCYYLNNDRVDLEAEDNTKVTPMFYTVMSNFTNGFMCMVSKKANIDHVDKFGNSFVYIATSFGNKFAYRFLQNHSKVYNINATYFKDDTTLADVLLYSKHTNICKYLMKHYNSQINFNSLVSANKERNSYKTVNVFNHEMMRATYIYKYYGSIIGLIRLCFLLRHFTYKSYIFSFFIMDLSLRNINTFIKYLSLILYCIVTVYCFFYYFEVYNFHLENSDNSIISFSTLKMAWDLSSILTLILAILKFIQLSFSQENEDIVAKKYTYDEDSSNALNHIRDAVSKDHLKLPLETDYCEVCLTRREENGRFLNMAHCSEINNCVINFHFFSRVLNLVISKSNLIYYIMLINSLIGMNLSIIYFLYSITDFECRINNSISIYVCESPIYNICIFLSHLSYTKLLLVAYLFIFSSYLLQILLAIFIALGYRSTYYFLWKLHKPYYKPILRLRNNKSSVCNVPPGPLLGTRGFLKNIWNFGDSNSEYEIGSYFEN